MLEDIGQLIAEENRDDRWRRLVGAQAVIVAGRGHDRSQQTLILVDGTNDGPAEDQELSVRVRRVAGVEQVALRGAAQRPVHVLARAVHAGKGLFVRQAGHAVFLGDPLERDHDQLLMVGGQVGRFEDRRDFVLAGGYLVVPRFDRYAQLVQFALDFQHEGQHALGNGPEIVIFEFLALGGLGAKQRAASGEQVGPREVEVAVDQEVFLLGTGRRSDERTVIVAEQFEDAVGVLVQSLHRAQHRRLLVECFARPGDERRRDAEGRAVGILQNVGRAGHVPDRVAAGFERGADAAGGEARTVRLALNQLPCR